MTQAFAISSKRAGGLTVLIAAGLMLGACVAPSRPIAGAPQAPAAGSVSVAGVTQGKMIGAGGAKPTLGQAITVRGMSNSQGNAAKKAAAAECSAVGGSFNELALASYDQINQAWVFIGACA